MLAQNSYETIGNDHKLRVNSNGILGIDLTTLSPSSYQEGTSNNYLNQAGLWIVAEDYNGNFYTSIQHVKALDSFDFWPGPVDTLTGQTGSVSEWNKVWPMSKQMIEQHQESYNKTGYTIPDEIATWPVAGGNGFSKYLAPFIDANNNAIYDPENGDYPFIIGDNAVYCIFNDLADEHTASFGVEIGLEIQLMAYTVENSNTIFLQYFIVSRKSLPYKNIKVGFFMGGECGYNQDNYAGTFSNYPVSTYIYNGDDIDEGYFGAETPYTYCVFLNENLAESIAFDNGKEKNGKPTSNADYQNYMNTKWRDGSELTQGGNGQNSGTPYSYIFDGSGAPNWIEEGNTNVGARNIVGIINTGPLNKNDHFKLDVGIGAGTISDFSTIKIVNEIFFNGGKDIAMYRSTASTKPRNFDNSILVYPNPSNGTFFIKNITAESTLNVYDNQGVKVHTETISKNR